jgi:protoporphyrinogen oxidase
MTDRGTLPRLAVLGGGVAGVTAAAHLARSGAWAVDLYEASGTLGGLHKSPMVGGVPYDIGAFLFKDEHPYFSTFPGLRAHFVPVRARGVSLRAGGGMDVFPLSLPGYLRDRGAARFALDLADLARCKLTARDRSTFRDYCRYYLGGRIYESTGLKAYVERLYALPDTEIGMEMARGRMGDLARYCSLSKMGWVLGLRRARDQGMQATLARPRGGFQQAYRLIHQELERGGVRVVTDARLRSITRLADHYHLVRDGEVRDYDRIVSTVPMDVTASLFGVDLHFSPPSMQLASLFYRLHGDPGFDGAVLYNYSRDGAWKRVTLFSSHYGTMDGDHWFTVECTAPESERVDLDQRRRAFEAHVARWPVLRGALSYQGGCVTPRAYPVYRASQESALARARQQLEAATGVTLTGRQGRFDYLGSSDVAARSRQVAESLEAPVAGAKAALHEDRVA